MSSSRSIAFRRRLHRRGGVYLAVLGASMIISILGVAGLYAVNIQAKISVNAISAMRADLAAHSGIEYARILMRTTDSWRNDIDNDKWTEAVPFDGGTLAYKLVDEKDGDLDDDAAESFRLYVKASYGKAVRIISVELQPASAGLMLPIDGTWRQEVMP